MADNPSLTPEQQQVQEQALARHQESQETAREQATGVAEGVPEGYNQDGTPKEELILGKFKTQEDLIKAYQEAERKITTNEETPKETNNDITIDNSSNEEVKEEKVEPKGLSQEDFNGYYQEFIDNGTLSEETYKNLEKQGLPKDVVDAYISGQQAITDNARQQVQQVVGGQEAYTELIEWAKESLTDIQKEDFNSKVTSGNIEAAKEAANYLVYLRQQAVGNTNPTRIQGESYSGNPNALKAFSDRNEYGKAVANRLYGKDAKYTNMVDKRYLESKKQGTI